MLICADRFVAVAGIRPSARMRECKPRKRTPSPATGAHARRRRAMAIRIAGSASTADAGTRVLSRDDDAGTFESGAAQSVIARADQDTVAEVHPVVPVLPVDEVPTDAAVEASVLRIRNEMSVAPFNRPQLLRRHRYRLHGLERSELFGRC